MKLYGDISVLVFSVQLTLIVGMILMKLIPQFRYFQIPKLFIIFTRFMIISIIFCLMIFSIGVYTQSKQPKQIFNEKKIEYTKEHLEKIVEKYATRYNVPIKLAKSVVQQESNWKIKAISKVQAIGLCQIMPSTFVAYADEGANPFDPHDNIETAMKYLSDLNSKTNDWRKTLTIYNGGYRYCRSKQAQSYANEVLARANNL